jgi:microcin C transport system permease protein
VDARVTENAPTPEPTTPAVIAAAVPAPKRRRFNMSRSTSGAGSNFKRNQRGYWALWLFLALFIASLFAEFIATTSRS